LFGEIIATLSTTSASGAAALNRGLEPER
jgi:hypothetical protein